MLTVTAALLPIFLLIVLGFIFKRTFIPDEFHWLGLETLTYHVLFPALLARTLARAHLAEVPALGVGAALLVAVLILSALCLALRPLLAAKFGVSGPSFTSIFQGATRWQTYVALAVSGNLYGDLGITLASVAMVAMIPLLSVTCVWVMARYASPTRLSWTRTLHAMVQNPLNWGCFIGLMLNLLRVPVPHWLDDVADALGRSSLAIGLLVIGAGLQMRGVLRPGMPALLTCFLKLVLMPVVAIGLGLAFGLSGANLAVVACCSSVPTAASAYVLARQMGGDAPLIAEIMTLETIFAVITMPLMIGLVA